MSDQEDYRRAKREAYEVETQPPATLGRDEFLAWRSPREVLSGPASLDNQTWHWLVRTHLSAFIANERFNGPSSYESGPMWCFDRFGMSQTTLSDGRIVYIGGEHEDHYDPDFYIYNDVIVIDPDGSIHIRGYSRDQFAATDFHTATMVGNSLLIIGCLGYPSDRVAGVTPVYRLSLDTWCIERMTTDGQSPGWLHGHAAELSEDGDSVVVTGGSCWLGERCSMIENIDSWSLNISSGHWTRLTSLDWQQWSMHRADRKFNRLWELRRALWAHENPSCGISDDWKFEDAPNFAELARLYRIDGCEPPADGEECGEYYLVMDGLTVRFTESMFSVDVLVKGRLSTDRLEVLQARTLATLAKLEGIEWEIEPLSVLASDGAD
ncbi:Kelch repeat-containing protein [Pseudomonas sp. PDM19]|uniref:Kelch repeat-containing protein n=1 Tax=Pseudomonas sp. PDM19 TaxID=2769272 RepID=UPI0017836D89|nr:kelch repeat-containing protein [Pseudomonas sp. PDM19]MBD9629362.1 hypothetical protein [Pseudomonas sp. PDM19]